MPKPKTDESKDDYIARFMESAEARSDYPDQKQRAAVAYSLWEHRNDNDPLSGGYEIDQSVISNIINSLHESARAFLLKNAQEGKWPKLYSCRFIEPGLVNYAEYGNVLVQRPVLDKMANSFVGKPVINMIHKEVTPEMYENGEADGIVTRVWNNQEDGWYWCEFIVWDDATRMNCESDAYSVSCAYKVSDLNPQRGEYHNIAYEQEVLDGVYTHLAVVANPRYEGARIVYNSKGGHMKLFKFWKNAEAKNAADIEKSIVDVDGKKVSVKELVEAHNSMEAKKMNVENMSDDTIIEVDGKEMPLKNLKDSYRSSMKNAEDDEDKKKKDKDESDMKNAEDEAKKKKEKEDEDMKNAEDEKKKKKEDEEKMENARREKNFKDLENAANRRGEAQKPAPVTRRELAAVGREKYGKAA